MTMLRQKSSAPSLPSVLSNLGVRIFAFLGILALAAPAALAQLNATFTSATEVPVTAESYTATGTINLSLGYAPAPGTTLTVIKNTGLPFISGQFSNLAQGQAVDLTFGGNTYSFVANYFGGSGNDLVLQWANTGVFVWGADKWGLTTIPSGARNGVIAISHGYQHILALKTDGSVIAWGSNSHGRASVPTAAQSNIVAIAAGETHSVALKNNGSVIVWGSYSNVPAEAQAGVVAIAAGGFHTVVLKSDGSVVAWGSSGNTNIPVEAQSGVIAIAAGAFHTLALKSDGSVVAWGGNDYGQSTVPASAKSEVIAIAASGYQSAVLKSNGSVIAWGESANGVNNIPAAAQSGVAAIALSPYHAAALKNDGSVVLWGQKDAYNTPMPSLASKYVSSIAAGGGEKYYVSSTTFWYFHCTAVMFPVLPNSPPSDITLSSSAVLENIIPKPFEGTIVGTLTATDPDEGQSHAFSLSPGGADNSSFSIIGNTLRFHSTADFETKASYQIVLRATDSNPFQPRTLDKALTISVTNVNEAPTFGGTNITLPANTSEPQVVPGWATLIDDGDSLSEQTLSFAVSHTNPALFTVPPSVSQNGTLSYTPSGISGMATVTVSLMDDASINGTAALTFTQTFLITVGPLEATFTSATDVSVTAESYSATGNTINLSLGFAPAPGTTLTVIKNTGTDPITGRFANLAQGQAVDLVYGGRTYPFIANYYGGSGNDLMLHWAGVGVLGWTPSVRSSLGTVPINIWNIPPEMRSGVLAVSSRGLHTLVLKCDSSVFAWGDNGSGQATVPESAKSGMIAVAAGGSHSLALKSDGSVIAWGLNDYGQVTVPAAAQSGVTAIAAGRSHSLALKNDGSVIAWGDNRSFQATVPSSALSGVIAIAAGENHSVALSKTGTVSSWGYAGQDPRRSMHNTTSWSNVVAISGGEAHTNGLTKIGQVLEASNYSSVTLGVYAYKSYGPTPSGMVASIASSGRSNIWLYDSGGVRCEGYVDSASVLVPPAAQSGVVGLAPGSTNVVMVLSGHNQPPTDITLSSNTIAENNLAGAVVATLTATDADAHHLHSFTLAPGGADNASFTIQGNSLKLTASANFSAKPNYQILIRATDNHPYEPASFDKAITLNVTRQLSTHGRQIAPPGTNTGPIPAGQLPAGSAPPLDVLFEVSDVSGVVKTVNPRFSFSPAHTSLDDLSIELISPDGTAAWLHAPSLVRENNLAGPYTISDSATASLQAASTGLGTDDVLASGSYRAANGETLVPLNLTFAGANPNGTWRLRFRNLQPGGTGTVSQASLTLATANPGKPVIAEASPGTFQIAVANLDPSAPYLLQGSTNLTTWTTLQTFTSTATGSGSLTDSLPRGQNYFYRVIPMAE